MSEPELPEPGSLRRSENVAPTQHGGLRKLPPISIAFNFLDGVKNLVIPFVAFAVFSGGGLSMGFFGALFVGGALFSALLRWVAFAYELGRDELVLETGILQRNERHVPYHRIQNIDLEQNPIHRALGVAKVRLETASGGKPEAVISVLHLDAVEEMRDHVFDRDERDSDEPNRDERAAEEDARPRLPAEEHAEKDARDRAVAPARRRSRRTAEKEHQLLYNDPRDLVLLGLISNRGMLVVAAVLGLLQQTGYFDDPDRLNRWIGEIPGLTEALDPMALNVTPVALWGVALVLIFVVLTRVLSVGWMLFKLWGFRLVRRGDDLRTEYGLFTRITATIPRHRVQLVSWHEGLLHQLFGGRASVKVETAGGGGAGGDSGGDQQAAGNSARLWLAPLLRRSGLGELFAEILPDADPETAEWQPVSERAALRLFRFRAVFLLAATGALVAGSAWAERPLWLPLPLLLFLPLLYWWARRYARHTAYALTPRAILFRSGAFGRHTSVVPFAKIQVVQHRQSLFDRRWHMASVSVDTAGANLSSHRVAVPLLDVDSARRVARRLEDEACETPFRW